MGKRNVSKTLLALCMSWLGVEAAIAAETYTIPMTVVPSSVRVNQMDPVGMPFSVPVSGSPAHPSTCGGSGTISAEVVNGGIEVEFDGSSTALPSGECTFPTNVAMVVEVQVPELGGTATMARFEATALVGQFTSIDLTSASIRSRVSGTTSSIPGRFKTDGMVAGVQWFAFGPANWDIAPIDLAVWVPGDTMRIPVDVSVVYSAVPGAPTQGRLRVRFVLKTTVPEPSAMLSIPAGVIGLVGLTALRGGNG